MLTFTRGKTCSCLLCDRPTNAWKIQHWRASWRHKAMHLGVWWEGRPSQGALRGDEGCTVRHVATPVLVWARGNTDRSTASSIFCPRSPCCCAMGWCCLKFLFSMLLVVASFLLLPSSADPWTSSVSAFLFFFLASMNCSVLFFSTNSTNSAFWRFAWPQWWCSSENGGGGGGGAEGWGVEWARPAAWKLEVSLPSLAFHRQFSQSNNPIWKMHTIKNLMRKFDEHTWSLSGISNSRRHRDRSPLSSPRLVGC